MIKRHRNVAHLWADKQVIRFFRKNFEKKHYKNFRSVYLALCEIDSDFGEGKEIGGFTKTVGTYAGLGKDTTSLYLRSLRDAGIINYQQDTKEGGQFGKNRLTIYKWEKDSDNLVSKLRKALIENHYLKIPSTENPPSGKSAQPKITPYKNTNKLVNNCKNSFSKEKESVHKPRVPKPETPYTNHGEKISENFKPGPAPFSAEVPNIPSNNEIPKINPNIPDQSQTSGKPKVNPLSKGDSNLISNSFSINSKNNPEMEFVRFFCKERKKQIPDSQFPKTSEELQKWGKDMQDIVNAGHNSETIKEIIRFVFNNDDPFWISRVAKPLHLKNSFETILGQMVKNRRNGKHKNEIDVHRGFLPKGPPEEAFAVI